MVAAAQQRHRAGDFVGAAEAYRAAVAQQPGLVDAWLNLALCEARMHRFTAAALAAVQAAQAAPGDARCWNLLAELLVRVEDPAPLAAVHELLSAQVPNAPACWFELAVALRRGHANRAARQMFDCAAILDPGLLPARWEAMQSMDVVHEHWGEVSAQFAEFEKRLGEFEALSTAAISTPAIPVRPSSANRPGGTF